MKEVTLTLSRGRSPSTAAGGVRPERIICPVSPPESVQVHPGKTVRASDARDCDLVLLADRERSMALLRYALLELGSL
jgi:hypothetical protein